MDLQDLQDDRRSDVQFGEDSHDTSEAINELKSSCTSCPSMFIHFVLKIMHRCLAVGILSKLNSARRLITDRNLDFSG